MSDLLVKLYELPPAALRDDADIVVRKPIGPEFRVVVDWVLQNFGDAWASEAQAALGNRPVTLQLALQSGEPVGFACHDATARGFFGPIGVLPGRRGRGIGAALLHASLADMRNGGYGYAVIGAAGAVDFFARNVGAVEIPGTEGSVYRGMIRRTAAGD